MFVVLDENGSWAFAHWFYQRNLLLKGSIYLGSSPNYHINQIMVSTKGKLKATWSDSDNASRLPSNVVPYHQMIWIGRHVFISILNINWIQVLVLLRSLRKPCRHPAFVRIDRLSSFCLLAVFTQLYFYGNEHFVLNSFLFFSQILWNSIQIMICFLRNSTEIRETNYLNRFV